jgi:glutamine synthetase
LRNPDPACNPYLAIAVALKAGLDGIKNKIQPPPPIDINIYHMTAEQREEMNISSLPASLSEALNELSQNDVIKSVLEPHVYEKFIEAKRREWESYRVQVHPWEVNEYLTKF